jgi:hypothetical protein
MSCEAQHVKAVLWYAEACRQFLIQQVSFSSFGLDDVPGRGWHEIHVLSTIVSHLGDSLGMKVFCGILMGCRKLAMGCCVAFESNLGKIKPCFSLGGLVVQPSACF